MPSNESGNRAAREPQSLEAWESWVDHLIVNAQARGDFDNLPGHGKPLTVEDAPYGNGLEVGLGMLKRAGVAPYWIELDKQIRAEQEEMETLLAQATALARSLPAIHDPEPVPAPPVRRGWRAIFQPRPSEPPAHPAEAGGVECDRLRRQYHEHAEKREHAIQEYNSAIPRHLWWLERPRYTLADAQRDWDKAMNEGTRDWGRCVGDGPS
jgi:hypothetical protein